LISKGAHKPTIRNPGKFGEAVPYGLADIGMKCEKRNKETEAKHNSFPVLLLKHHCLLTFATHLLISKG